MKSQYYQVVVCMETVLKHGAYSEWNEYPALVKRVSNQGIIKTKNEKVSVEWASETASLAWSEEVLLTWNSDLVGNKAYWPWAKRLLSFLRLRTNSIMCTAQKAVRFK